MPEETNVNPELGHESNQDQPSNEPAQSNELPPVTEKSKKSKAEKQSKSVTDLLNEAFQEAKTEDRRREVLKALKAQKDAEELAAKVLG